MQLKFLAAVPVPEHQPGARARPDGAAARRRDHRGPAQDVARGDPPQMGQLPAREGNIWPTLYLVLNTIPILHQPCQL